MSQCPLRLLALVSAISRVKPDPLGAAGCQMKPVILRAKVLEIEMYRLGEPIGRQPNPPDPVDPVESMLDGGRVLRLLAPRRKVEGFRENQSLAVQQSRNRHIVRRRTKAIGVGRVEERTEQIRGLNPIG